MSETNPESAAAAWAAIAAAQDVLARVILPEGGPTSEDAINELLGILDHCDLVLLQRRLGVIGPAGGASA